MKTVTNYINYKKFSAIFVSIFLLLSLLPNLVIAQSPEETTVTFGDPGSTSGIGHIIDLWWEGLTGVTPEEQANERLDELHALIQEENTKNAEVTATELVETLEIIENNVNAIDPGTTTLEQVSTTEDTPIHELLTVEETIIGDSGIEDKVDAIHQELTELVDAGTITTEIAAAISNPIQEETIEVIVAVEEQKEEEIEEIAKTSDVSVIEVELAIDDEEEEEGLHEEHKKEVTTVEIASLETAIEEVKKEVIENEKEGHDEEAHAMEVLLANAELHLQRAVQASKTGDTGEAFGQFNAAKHLALNADKISDKTFSELPKEEVAKIEELGKTGEEIREEIHEDSASHVKEWEEHKDELLVKYPEEKEFLETEYKTAKETLQLTDKLAGKYNDEYEKLKAEGKTQEQIDSKLTEAFSQEFQLAYGEEYTPPGFIEEKTVVGDQVKIELGGGFVEGHEYADLTTGGKYKFGDNGYTFVSALGGTHYFEYPEGYDPKTYSRGDESFDYTTPEGYKYEYAATGYVITKPDGTKEEHPYEPGKYEVVGGAEIKHTATGFECKSEEGKTTKFDFDPGYGTYIANDGKVLITETSFLEKEVEYNANNKKYEYSHEGKTWVYDPAKDVWTSSTGETHKPVATVGAPIGHEDEGHYNTEHGEAWTYDSATGKWKDSGGKEYTPPPSAYYSYDAATGEYRDEHGESHEGSVSHGGDTWTYDSSTGKWSSATGETYNPSTGQSTGGTTYTTGGYHEAHPDSTGHVGPYEGTYIYSGSSGAYTGSYSETTHTDTGGGGGGGGDSGGGGHSGHVIYEPTEEVIIVGGDYRKYRLF